MDDDKNVPATVRSQLPDAEGRIDDLLNGLANIRNTIQEAGGISTGLPFLSINNAGVWGFGQDRIEVEANSLWAIDIRTWKHGYIAWPDQKVKDRKPLYERMVPASLPKPDVTTLPDVGEPYQVQFSFELLCMSGQDAGTRVLYKNGSYGARQAADELAEKVELRAMSDRTKPLCPVVTLVIRPYEHPGYKKTVYSPILSLQKWITFADFDKFGDSVEAELEETPAPQVAARGNGRRRAPEPEPEPAPKPVPRRPGSRTQPR